MRIYDKYQTDPKLETEGRWVDFGGFKLKLARANTSNPRFVEVSERRARPHQKDIERRVFSRDDANVLSASIYAEAVVVDWEGVTNADGYTLQPTFDNKLKVLLDLPDLFDDIVKVSDDREAYLRQAVEDDAGN